MKSKRQELILSIIKEKIVLTQEDLQNELLNLGYDVTQSTVSRDIKELKLVKGHDSAGNYRYISTKNNTESNNSSHFKELFVKSVKSVDYSLNNVVIKCFTGMASTACVALDEMFSDMMLGSLAGDDTIFIVTKSVEHSKELCNEVKKIL